MDEKTRTRIDNLLAFGWANDAERMPGRDFAYIGVTGLLIIVDADGRVKRYKLEEV